MSIGYFVAGVPTLFLCACMFFALATATRSMMGSYIGADRVSHAASS